MEGAERGPGWPDAGLMGAFVTGPRVGGRPAFCSRLGLAGVLLSGAARGTHVG